MVYYVFDSCHEDSNGYTTGWMHLKEEQGPSIPENSIKNNGRGFLRKQYFSTYKEAKDFFQINLREYWKSNTRNIRIETRDEIARDYYTYEA